MRREVAFGVFCLTTVYPIYTTVAHGNSGDKSAGKDVVLSGKGRKRPEISGDRYSQILWELDVTPSDPVAATTTKETAEPSLLLFQKGLIVLVVLAKECGGVELVGASRLALTAIYAVIYLLHHLLACLRQVACRR